MTTDVPSRGIWCYCVIEVKQINIKKKRQRDLSSDYGSTVNVLRDPRKAIAE